MALSYPGRCRACRRARGQFLASLAVVVTAGPAAPAAPPPPPERALASCVAATPPVALPAGQQVVLLEPDDAAAVHTAALARWPVLAQHGVDRVRVLMLGGGPAAAGWRYLMLDTGRAGAAQPCVWAVLSGPAFGFTPELVRKYRAGAPPGAASPPHRRDRVDGA